MTSGSKPVNNHFVATLIAPEIQQATLSKAQHALGGAGLSIRQTTPLSGDAFEILLQAQSKFSRDELRDLAIRLTSDVGADLILQSEEGYRSAKRFIAFDMDSTLITCEVIDELAREKGVYEEVAAITRAAMKGNLDFSQSLTERCLKLKGLSVLAMERVAARIELTSGANELVKSLKAQGYKTALLSGGFIYFAERIQKQLGLDYAYANTLEFKDGVLTGKVTPPLIDAKRKAELLEEISHRENIPLSQTVAVGDGANDLLMIEKAGLGIAFNAKPAVAVQAMAAIHQKSLLPITYLLMGSAKPLG